LFSSLPRSPVAVRSGGSPQHGLITLQCGMSAPVMDDRVAFGGIQEVSKSGRWSSNHIQA
jgi:hypothetical protein